LGCTIAIHLQQLLSDPTVKTPVLKIALTCIAGGLLCTLILITGPEPLTVGARQDAPQVTVSALNRSLQPREVVAYGTLNPRKTLALKTQVSGEIIWTHENFVPGGVFDQDAVLFKVDDRDHLIALESAEARYEQAQAIVDIEQGRYEIAQREWSTWQSDQNLKKEPSPLALREPQKTEVEARRKTILAEIRRVKLLLERTVVRAPWPASVVTSNAVLGQVLGTGDTVGVLYPLDYGVVDLQIPIKTLGLIEPGIEQVTLHPIDNLSSQGITGVFERSVKILSDDTRLATVRVRLDRPLQYPGWAFGMPIKATFAVGTQPVVLVSPDLIISGNSLWIYREGRAMLHQIYPLAQKDRWVAVEDNFDSADKIVLQRPIGLFDGALADIVES
jgi:hypothetical protein